MVCAKSKKSRIVMRNFAVKIANANLQDPLLGCDTVFPNLTDYSISVLSPH